MYSRKFAAASLSVALIGSVVAVKQCASTGDEVGSTTVTAANVGGPSGACPVRVPGTRVTSTTADDGYATLDFTTSSDVAELRARVRGMAETNNRNPGRLRMAAGDRGGVVMMPAANASVEDVPGGARLVLRPASASQLDALRRDAPAWAERLSYGECPSLTPAPAQEEPRVSPREVPVNHDILTPPPFPAPAR